MAVNVEVETVIRRPRKLVSEYAADPSNAPAWYGNIESIKWQTPPPAQIGSRLEFVAHFLGRRLVYTMRSPNSYRESGWSCERRTVRSLLKPPTPGTSSTLVVLA